MNVLDSLIKVKKTKQSDDLLKILDEVQIYEKLSLDEKLKDLKTSTVTRAKCPLLAGFADGNFYETLLVDLAANIYLQIEERIPAVLTSPKEETGSLEKSVREKRQKEILKEGIAEVNYTDLLEYDPERMEHNLAAVFTKQNGSYTTAVIVTRTPTGYTMYHGIYNMDQAKTASSIVLEPIIVKTGGTALVLNSYSMLGNNGYPFAKYEDGFTTYDVMIGPDQTLYLINGQDIDSEPISTDDANQLSAAKMDPENFAKTLLSIITKMTAKTEKDNRVNDGKSGD